MSWRIFLTLILVLAELELTPMPLMNPLHFQAQYFDGLTSSAHHVAVTVLIDRVELQGATVNLSLPFKALQFVPAVGSVKAIALISGGAELHIADIDAYDDLVRQLHPKAIERLSRFLERRVAFVILALVFSVAFIFVGLRYALPSLALSISQHLPAGFESTLGNESLSLLDNWLMKPSELSLERQQSINTKLQHLCQSSVCAPFRLHFRKSTIGANAFALPGGEIVVIDDLVKIAEHDEEILAVLFHELGHVLYRHSLRIAIQNAGTAVLLISITGDIGTISDLAAGLPALLMQTGYQREMENEADTYALSLLNKNCIAPHYFADILLRITNKMKHDHKDQQSQNNLFSTHPDTESRIKRFQVNESCKHSSKIAF